VRILFLLYDALPAFRPDVSVLFGKELPKQGIGSDLLGQLASEDKRAQALVWPAGSVFLHGLNKQGLLHQLMRPFLDLAMVWRLNPQHDVIQVRDKIRTGLLGLIVARLTGRKFTYWMSFLFAEGFKLRYQQVGLSRGRWVATFNWLRAQCAGWIYYYVLAPRVDHLFVQSDAMLEFMRKKGVASTKMTAVPMGVDVEVFSAISRAQTVPPELAGRRVIAYLGVVGKSRNSGFLLDILVAVQQRVPDVFLLVVGDGASDDEKAWFRSEILARQLEKSVLLTGWMPQLQALPLLKCAEVGLSPIPRDYLFDTSSPTKAVEYLALGIPCVGSDSPDQKLVIEQSGGGICVPMDVTSFSDAVLKLLADPGDAKDRGVRGQAWVAQHRSYQAIAAKVAAVYQQLLAR